MVFGLPEKLRKMREMNGLSQKIVAERLDVSPSIVSSYENGDRTPSVPVLLSLSYVYNCSVDYLLGKHQPNSEAVFIEVTDLTDDQIRIVNELVNELKKK